MELINSLLCLAVQGESEAEQKYLLFSEKAVSDGYPGVATLFTGLSYAESIHIANHKKAMEKNNYAGPFPSIKPQIESGSTLENVTAAIEGEKEEFTTMYPSFSRQIQKKYGNIFIAKIALLSIKWATESEKNHHSLLKEAQQSVISGTDLNDGDMYLCAVCGNVHYSSERPQQLCPVCGHDLSFYSKVEILP